MKNIFRAWLIASLVPAVVLAQTGKALDEEVNSELDQMYKANSGTSGDKLPEKKASAKKLSQGLPVKSKTTRVEIKTTTSSIVNKSPQSEVAGNNEEVGDSNEPTIQIITVPQSSKGKAKGESVGEDTPVYKQPTTVVEASPLVESKAEKIRKSRQDAEVATEQGIVEKLEQSRLEDEKRRAEVLFGDKFNVLMSQGRSDANASKAAKDLSKDSDSTKENAGILPIPVNSSVGVKNSSNEGQGASVVTAPSNQMPTRQGQQVPAPTTTVVVVPMLPGAYGPGAMAATTSVGTQTQGSATTPVGPVPTSSLTTVSTTSTTTTTQPSVAVTQPVVTAPVVQVVEEKTVLAAPSVNSTVGAEKDSAVEKQMDREMVREEISAAMADLKKTEPEKTPSRHYFSVLIGAGDYPDAQNVKAQYSLGLALGKMMTDRLVLEGSFIYSNYQVEQKFLNSYYMSGSCYYDYAGNCYPRITEMNQYATSGLLKYQFLDGSIKPEIGGLLTYNYRTFTDKQFAINNGTVTSQAFDAGIMAGLGVELSESLTLGLDMRYSWNLTNKVNGSGLQKSSIYSGGNSDTAIEDLSYWNTAISLKSTF